MRLLLIFSINIADNRWFRISTWFFFFFFTKVNKKKINSILFLPWTVKIFRKSSAHLSNSLFVRWINVLDIDGLTRESLGIDCCCNTTVSFSRREKKKKGNEKKKREREGILISNVSLESTHGNHQNYFLSYPFCLLMNNKRLRLISIWDY